MRLKSLDAPAARPTSSPAYIPTTTPAFRRRSRATWPPAPAARPAEDDGAQTVQRDTRAAFGLSESPRVRMQRPKAAIRNKAAPAPLAGASAHAIGRASGPLPDLSSLDAQRPDLAGHERDAKDRANALWAISGLASCGRHPTGPRRAGQGDQDRQGNGWLGTRQTGTGRSRSHRPVWLGSGRQDGLDRGARLRADALDRFRVSHRHMRPRSHQGPQRYCP